jgi:hypothetical protein
MRHIQITNHKSQITNSLKFENWNLEFAAVSGLYGAKKEGK